MTDPYQWTYTWATALVESIADQLPLNDSKIITSSKLDSDDSDLEIDWPVGEALILAKQASLSMD